MEASVGDRIVVAGAVLGAHVRDGEIIEVKGEQGGPPYVVRWFDSGRESLFFPGPDSHVDHLTHAAGGADTAAEPVATPAPAGGGAGARHVKRWLVDVYLYEGDNDTAAHAVLHTESASPLDARGRSRRSPEDRDVPEIGDEVAAARALRRLADRLLGVASDDLAALEGHPVELRR